MIIHDSNLVRLAVVPFEDHPPLIVDSDRVEILQITLQLLQPVRWGDRQILQPAGGVDSFEFPLRGTGDSLELTDEFITEQRLGRLVAERSDHPANLPDTGIGSRAAH